MREFLLKLWGDEQAAIAPTLAIILFVLVAAGGIAFDYSRLATLDTELQNAADQAALAAAGQLDGTVGSQARATAAAQSLVQNLTYFANDGDSDGTTIRIVELEFYRNYDADRANLNDPPGDEATGDTDSRYVRVAVETRRANFAFTPVVAAFGGDATAHALAGLGSAYCNVPPFMICQPSPTFDPEQHIGEGMKLVIGSPTTPGNFGFLQTGFGTGAANLARAIGYNGSFGGCLRPTDVTTEPGAKESVRAAFNTRFDMSESGQTCPALPTGGQGTCSPSTNARKDLVHDAPPYNNPACRTGGNAGWTETNNPYRGRSDALPLTTDGSQDPNVMGHPRDLCHAVSQNGACGGSNILGNGTWDRDAYFRVNYQWDAAGTPGGNDWVTRTGLSSAVSRYNVYLWEAANPTPANTTGGIGRRQGPYTANNGNGNPTPMYADSSPVCRSPGISPVGNPDGDRRRTTVAIVDCSNPQDPSGRDQVTPGGWMDVFLVEPAFARGTGSNARTGDGDIYVEIIGGRVMPGLGGTVGGVVRRDVPQLLE